MVFTVLNELEYPMTYGLGSMTLFFLVGIICLLLMGNRRNEIITEHVPIGKSCEMNVIEPVIGTQYRQLTTTNPDNSLAHKTIV